VNKVVPVSSPEVAETAKLYENVFRNVNIALANEMALICEKIGVSVWEVIDAAATKPFGFTPFYPGVGVGGHCIGVDDYYLIDKSVECGYQPRLDKVALALNEEMPMRVARQVAESVNTRIGYFFNTRILVLGVAFKKDVSDVRESPSVELIGILQSWGADVIYNDPYVPRLSDRMVSEELDDELLESVDCVIIATDHSCYDWIVEKSRLVFDTRNVTKGIVSSKIYRLGERKAE
jgi:UDP-N-acetyl-D-glucosamine dehydrogenase